MARKSGGAQPFERTRPFFIELLEEADWIKRFSRQSGTALELLRAG
jgi:hypothetical protein